MTKAVATIVQISLFRAKPQDLPANSTLLGASVLFALILFSLRNGVMIDGGSVFSLSILQIILLGLALYLLLSLFSKKERWMQSATALYGCSAVIQACLIPFLISSGTGELRSDTITLSKYVILGSGVWYFAVIVSILKETLDINYIFSGVITLVVQISFAIVLILLFGDKIL